MGFLSLRRLEKANISKANEIAFSWHQNNLEVISMVFGSLK